MEWPARLPPEGGGGVSRRASTGLALATAPAETLLREGDMK